MTTSLTTVTSNGPGTTASNEIDTDCLEPLQLIQLEWSFRQWVKMTSRYESRMARKRQLIIFLLLRYSGATLEEVLNLNLETDLTENSIVVHAMDNGQDVIREAPLVRHIAQEVRESLQNPDIYFTLTADDKFKASVVRHTFYQRAAACGFPESLCSPNRIRWARFVELQRAGVSAAKIEQMMGAVAPAHKNQPCSHGKKSTFRGEKHIFKRTRGRNSFAGNIVQLQRDTLQSQVILCTPEGHHITAIVSNDSADRLALQSAGQVTAEVKPHAVSLQTDLNYATSSVDNCFAGEIVGITRGRVSWECVVHIGEGTNVYSLNSVHYAATLDLKVGKQVWVAFNSFAVILRVT